MTSITIRNLEDRIAEQLRIAAAHNGHSMEKEACLILEQAVASLNQTGGLGSRIRDRFSASGGVELDLPQRRV